MVTSFCKKDAIAPNTQNIISKYSKAVSIPSRNVRNAVRTLSSKLIGNKIIFIIHLIIAYSSLPKPFFVSILIESNQRAFLKVTSDGTVVFVGRTEPAMTYSFSGNQVVEVETGNASALRIQYNNRNLGSLGGYAEVKKIAFSEGYIQNVDARAFADADRDDRTDGHWT